MNLDPTFSYMVIEKKVEADESGPFSEIIRALAAMDKNILGRQISRDEVPKNSTFCKNGPRGERGHHA